MVHISVIVCCYNSEKLLKETLTHLVKQDVKDGFVYEVILVDNNSCDQTAQVARDLWSQFKTTVCLNIIKEEKPGLSYARKTGVLASKGGIIIFCDDDNWLQVDYLQIAYGFMNSNPKVGALGGQSEGVLEIEEPNWWHKEKLNYAVGVQGGQDGDITKRGYVWGAGLVIRSSILQRLYDINFESLLTDRVGSELSSGGDSEICKWVLLMDYKLWYLESLRFKHYITKNRLTDEYLIKLLEGHKQAQPLLNLYNWFFYNGIFKKVNSLTLKNRGSYIKKAIKCYIRNDKSWSTHCQLALGTFLKIHTDLYLITKTYRRLSKKQLDEKNNI
ncbi:glycosyltransferase family 2 protein [Tamlana haliotis]|uniref:Glycosyltransferase family 2 protein n=1 Tax=Pseudotamlana haliotis TaxID=2614804 RepID=A0A6N6M951_9FLAO|nr:glycosyltransferase [Tamlana haliotis]KAB1067019.1 glycosyltransferase family 2 protein [Tamlana haliotis]